ncbi:C40 family peptidase [Hazenella sp. IB182357]|uniref:C40 family peptidase n=1 Tax=Polycladospora coralii TaxID=2771432 RepID=A0A926RV26_9BACL|nr:C40 family peptidase [Polycladospora coralii]MBD1373094.1 C40 family peptidase [Polycladospora coralii]MBS7529561.1 C40 family peptidase [Polycladospora coralii]
MIKHKKLKTVTLTLAATLLVSVAIPTNVSFAATSEGRTQDEIINSVFSKFGWTWNNGTADVKSETKTKEKKDSKSNKEKEKSNKEKEKRNDNTEGSTTTAEKDTKDTNDGQATTAVADTIITTGEKYLGTPYQFGARSGQTSTFDCSSFVQHVYSKNGISLPRSSREQATVGTTVSMNNLQKGDLIFTTTSSSGSTIGHVGIYAGNGKVLHTYGPGGVRYDNFDGWLKAGFVTAKRVIK